MSIANQPAFPHSGNAHSNPLLGMSYRQWLIGRAMQGLLGNPNAVMDQDECAESAIIHADAVIARLDSEGKAA